MILYIRSSRDHRLRRHISLRKGGASIKPFGAKAFSALFFRSTLRALPRRIFLIFLASALVVIRFFLCVFLRAQASRCSTTRCVCPARIYFRKATRAVREDNSAPSPRRSLPLPSNSFFASLRCANSETGQLCRVRSILPTPGVSLKNGKLATQRDANLYESRNSEAGLNKMLPKISFSFIQIKGTN